MQRVLWLLVMAVLPVSSFAQDVLERYLAGPEPAYAWEEVDHDELFLADVYDLRLTSLTWQGSDWTHHLRITVPKILNNASTALLFIWGGNNEEGQPTFEEDPLFTAAATLIATQSQAITVELYQIPNQPLYDRVEDDLLAYTFQQFVDTGNEEWPIILPMAKASIQAMNAVQEFAQQRLSRNVRDFVVAGASKRGWTSWMVGASGDDRVIAIAPIVYDTLNIATQLDYQLEVWGDFSTYIRDYVLLGLPGLRDTPVGEELLSIVDPYSYRDRLTMSRYLIIGTNDPYWPVDALRQYVDDLQGPTAVRYFANAPHDLGDEIADGVQAVADYFTVQARGGVWPTIEADVYVDESGGVIELVPDSDWKEVNLWTTSSDDRDFRDAGWVSSRVSDIAERTDPTTGKARFEFAPAPDQYQAVFLDLHFDGPAFTDVVLSTRMLVIPPETTSVDAWVLY